MVAAKNEQNVKLGCGKNEQNVKLSVSGFTPDGSGKVSGFTPGSIRAYLVIASQTITEQPQRRRTAFFSNIRD